MANQSFQELLNKRWSKKLFVCVGLDPLLEKIPDSVKQDSIEQTIVAFNRAIIDATVSFVCAFKPNSAFYEAYGAEGISALKQTVRYIKEKYPEIPVILDAKRGDIDSTNEGYVKFAFEYLGADAITLHPYLGREALEPFIKLKNKGIFILVKTSNKGSGEFQDLKVENKPLYQAVAENVLKEWNTNGNCGIVVGGTYSDDLKNVRMIVGDMPILIPGIGAQGGDVAKTVAAGKNRKNTGIIISSSRGIIYASAGADFAKSARNAAEVLNKQIIDALNNG